MSHFTCMGARYYAKLNHIKKLKHKYEIIAFNINFRADQFHLLIYHFSSAHSGRQTGSPPVCLPAKAKVSKASIRFNFIHFIHLKLNRLAIKIIQRRLMKKKESTITCNWRWPRRNGERAECSRRALRLPNWVTWLVVILSWNRHPNRMSSLADGKSTIALNRNRKHLEII